MTESTKHIVCPHCDATNRVPSTKPANGAICGRCRRRLFSGEPISVSARSFNAHVNRGDIPVVVDFWASWCGPCKAMAPTYERVAKEFEPGFRFLKADTEAEPALAAQFGIRSIPTLMLFRNGAPVAQQAGAVDGQSLRMWLQRNAV